jgi:hypothetical protein
MEQVHSFWFGSTLSPLECSCYRSWTKQGYQHNLWTYGDVGEIPEGTVRRDAAQVLPADRIFQYQAGSYGLGSYSGFSNFFRYRLLGEVGGIWADSDMYCLRPLPDQDYLFVQECEKVATCLFRVPPQSALLRSCWDFCDAADVTKLQWAQSGPFLLSREILRHQLTAAVQPSALFLPVMWPQASRLAESPALDLVECYTVHFWHEQLRQQGVDKQKRYPGSTFDQLIYGS